MEVNSKSAGWLTWDGLLSTARWSDIERGGRSKRKDKGVNGARSRTGWGMASVVLLLCFEMCVIIFSGPAVAMTLAAATAVATVERGQDAGVRLNLAGASVRRRAALLVPGREPVPD
jgi:hypothetical protein